jgi:hypothetical protein
MNQDTVSGKPHNNVPPQPANSFRVVLELTSRQSRIDVVLIEELRKQDRNHELKNLSRNAFKALFKAKRVQIKGQSAVPSSAVAAGTTYVDILGYTDL